MRGIALALLVCACKPAPTTSTSTVSSVKAPPRASGIHYTVRVASDLAEIEAEVCFEGPRPTALVAPSSEAAALLVGDEDGTIVLDGVTGCIDYRVRVGEVLAKPSDGARRVGDEALLSPDWWLWIPDEQHRDAPLHVRFRLPGGMHAVVPWTPENDGFRVPATIFMWQSQAAFVRRAPEPLGALTVARVGSFGERDGAVASWLASSARAATDLVGPFPTAPVHTVLVADPERRATFGFAVRGGGPVATLLLPDDPGDALLAEEWVATHELLHFFLPPMPASESWFFEGFTTYLTTLARERAGITSARYGWWELLDGFERGSKVGTGATLRDECVTMHENHTYWRVYWSGAFIALAIDVELHRKGQSLAQLVRELATQKLDPARRWTAADVLARLDALCSCDLFTRVPATHLDSTQFPDTTALRAALGVALAGKRVSYDDAATDAPIRKSIMAD